MRVLERGSERIEIAVEGLAITVRRYVAGELVHEAVRRTGSLVKAKWDADWLARRELDAGFHQVAAEVIVALDHVELMAAIEAAPDDNDTKLVLADWLTERNDPWGQLIALQHAKEALPPDAGDRYDELEFTELELRFRIASRLWGKLADPAHANGTRLHYLVRADWECGFVREVTIEHAQPATFPLIVEGLATLDTTRLLRQLTIGASTWHPGMLEVLATHCWPHLRELAITGLEAVTTARLIPLVDDACMPALAALDLIGIASPDTLCRAIATRPIARRLRSLTMQRCHFGDDAIQALVTAPFDVLEELHLGDVGPAHAATTLAGVAARVVVDWL